MANGDVNLKNVISDLNASIETVESKLDEVSNVEVKFRDCKQIRIRKKRQRRFNKKRQRT